MTDDLNHGLDLLADEIDPAPVDTHDIIAKAKARTRNKRAGVASALGTVAVAAAMAATIGLTGADGRHTATPTTATTSANQEELCAKPDTTCITYNETDEQSRRLTEQLAAAREEVIPTRLQVLQDTHDPDPLEFVISGPGQYMARAKLRDEIGEVHFLVYIREAPAGATSDTVSGIVISPCTVGVRDCQERILPDGTVAKAETYNQLTAMQPNTDIVALRPDGTQIEVLATVAENRPAPPLTLDELFRFATVFTY